MPRRLFAAEDLIDALGVAEMLGLASRTAVSTYMSRYDDMPRPVLDLGKGRPRLWLRSEIEAWARKRARPQGGLRRRPTGAGS